MKLELPRRSLLVVFAVALVAAGCKPTTSDETARPAAPAASSSTDASAPADRPSISLRVETVGNHPSPRIGAAGLAFGGTLYQWGGTTSADLAVSGVEGFGAEVPLDAGASPERPNDLEAIDTKTGEVRVIQFGGARPRGALFPVMTLDERTNRLYVFGGWSFGADKPVPGMFFLDVSAKEPVAERIDPVIGGPIGRFAAAAVSHTEDGAFFLFGGDAGSGLRYLALADLWRYGFEDKKFTRVAAGGPPPPPRRKGAMAIDEGAKRLYVFGGSGDDTRGKDPQLYALALDELSWKVVEATGDAPPPLEGATMTFDPELHALVIAGGFRLQPAGEDATTADIFVLDLEASHWTKTSVGPAVQRRDHVGVYDPATKSHLLVGGRVSDYFKPGVPVAPIVRITLARDGSSG